MYPPLEYLGLIPDSGFLPVQKIRGNYDSSDTGFLPPPMRQALLHFHFLVSAMPTAAIWREKLKVGGISLTFFLSSKLIFKDTKLYVIDPL